MKYFPFFIVLSLVLCASFALADANLDIAMSTTTLSGNHNSAVGGSFILNNTNTGEAINNFTCTVTAQSWGYSCTPPASIASNQSQTQSFSVTVPQYTSPGSYSGTILVTGNLATAGTAVSDTQAFSVTVASSGSYSIAWTTSPSNIYQTQNQTVAYNITNTGNVALTTSTVMDLGNLTSSTANQSHGSVAAQGTAAGSVSIDSTDESFVGPQTITLSVTGLGTDVNGSASDSKTFTLLYPYCDDIELLTTNLTRTPIRIDEIKNEKDIEDEDFKPLETIEIDVKIENRDDEDRITAIAEAVLVFEDGEVDDTDDEVKVKIDEEDTEGVTLIIEVPADIEEGVHYLYLKVYNDDDEDNCEQEVIALEIKKSGRETVPTATEFPSEVNCGDMMTFSGKAVNVGEKDEEKVKVAFKAFGYLFEEIYNDLDEGDYSSLFSFDMKIPKNATTGTQKMILNIYSDYDDDDNTFDEAESFSYSTSVSCTSVETTFNTETSVALLGKESEVRVLVNNPDDDAHTYVLSASADWAEVESVSPATMTLSAGGQQYITVKLTPDKKTNIGTHNLVFTASYAGKTEALNVPVTVQKSTSSSNVLEKISFEYKNNTAWAVINTVLVLAILGVLLMIFTGKSKPDFSGMLAKLKSLNK